ncbi:hypothetical protein PIB30_072908 [Stylosanthes scabra]|uniref:Uncharacterized protein n=1 Tax=Stylosanthes scabra TaxID=79078 RepID=A0ABU6RQF1_9FABA|nr:hypothetical protein [Stylosanthes scabra]
MNSTLAKSLQIEGPSQKKILGKRKQTEEEKSLSESEPEMESESESESESEIASYLDSEKTISEDENVGRIERRTKKMHEAINVAPLQPPQHGEADANPGAAIDALADPSSQVNLNLSSDVEIENITPLGDTKSQEDPTKDADSAATMGVERVEEEDTHHDAVIVDPIIETAPPKHIVPAAAMGVESVEEENTHHNAMIVDATIETAPPKHTVPAAAMGG